MIVARSVSVVSLLAASSPSSLLAPCCLFFFSGLFPLLSSPFPWFLRFSCLASVRPVLLCPVCLSRLLCLVACVSRSWAGYVVFACLGVILRRLPPFDIFSSYSRGCPLATLACTMLRNSAGQPQDPCRPLNTLRGGSGMGTGLSGEAGGQPAAEA